VPALERERMIDIAYEGEGVEAYPVQFLIRSAERPGMLFEITSVLAENKINILGCNIDERDLNKGEVQIWLKVELTSVGQVSQVMSKLEKVQNVFEVRRLASGNKR
jgi:GTP pyrophosphokinase